MHLDDNPKCPQCGQQDQQTHTINAFGNPWKYIRACSICWYASEATTPEEALRKFSNGIVTFEVKQ